MFRFFVDFVRYVARMLFALVLCVVGVFWIAVHALPGYAEVMNGNGPDSHSLLFVAVGAILSVQGWKHLRLAEQLMAQRATAFAPAKVIG
jgi:hypothetical protein